MSDLYVTKRESENSIKRIHGGMRIFLILVILLIVLFVVIFGVNAFLYVSVAKKSCGSTINQGQGNILFWLNIIFAVISGIALALGILLNFYSHDYKSNLKNC